MVLVQIGFLVGYFENTNLQVVFFGSKGLYFKEGGGRLDKGKQQPINKSGSTMMASPMYMIIFNESVDHVFPYI